jgi:hypothetical protein
MTKREIEQYTNAGQHWLKASAVVGSIFAGVVIVMALASSDSPMGHRCEVRPKRRRGKAGLRTAQAKIAHA